tara:strand:- start:5152 stop:6204 length:1053 start_codon:yes stop_codon:yes gene_type:complete
MSEDSPTPAAEPAVPQTPLPAAEILYTSTGDYSTPDSPPEPAPSVDSPAKTDLEPPVEAADDKTIDKESGEADTDTGEGHSDDTPSVSSSLKELTESQDWDPEWVSSLEVDVKVDGKPAKATISEMVKSYQIGKAAEHRLEEAKAKSVATNNEIAEKTQTLQGQFTVSAKLLQEAEQLLELDQKGVDWKILREDDPAEYSARRTEYQDRQNRIAELKAAGARLWENTISQGKEQSAEDIQTNLQKQASALVEKVPDWSDPKKAKVERAELVEYMTNDTVGYSQDEVLGASDHRLIVLARKAMLYDASQAKTDAALKKVRTVPKLLKPGPAKENPAPQSNGKIDHASILYG